jgi:tetratricopeptide (TPR) repeat protein
LFEAKSIQWLALDDSRRRRLSLQLLQQIPVLWIWDNIEPVSGFPTGTPSVWTQDEQQDLVRFLRELGTTRAKVLVTSRRDEQAWLGELPRRVQLPEMPMTERVQLARAVADRHGQPLTGAEDWRPLLAFTQGNPLTVTMLVGQALREGIRSREQVEGFVERLRAGQAEIHDEEELGRSASLGASLGYGFAQAFSDADQPQLALLHLFQGFVDVDVLCWMGDPEQVGEPVPEVRGLTREAGIGLLDRAAEVGLLTPYGGGYYGIHPALPWYFQRLFTATYGPPDNGAALRATRAYTTAFGLLGDYYWFQYQQGRRLMGLMSMDEANLLQARRMARDHGWWDRVIGPMQGLRAVHQYTGRTVEWARLVDELVPDLVDPTTDGPPPGRENPWRLVTEYRAKLALAARDFEQAERLQQTRAAFDRTRAGPALALAPEALNASQRHQIRSLAVSVEGLGHVLREQDQPGCVTHYEEALELFGRIGDRQGQAVVAFNLGHVYLLLADVRDLDQAESWYKRSLGLRVDGLGRAKCFGQLGIVAHERFIEARAAGLPDAEALLYLQDAEDATQRALDLTPSEAVRDRGVMYTQLGRIHNEYTDLGALQATLRDYQEAIRSFEAAEDRYSAASARYNVALALRDAGGLDEAQLWAQAALRDFETFGDLAADRAELARQLLAQIEAAIAQGREGG